MSALMLLFSIGLFLVGIGRREGIRESLLVAYMGLYLVVVLSTESLSLFSALSFLELAILWTALAGTSLFLAWRIAGRRVLGEAKNEVFMQIKRASPLTCLCLGVIACIMGATLVVALFSPPNTWDSMTYHMARISAWIQQGSVKFYPTAIERQNYQLPLGGFAVLQLQLLNRSDLLANLVQWTSFVACIVLVTLIIKEFKQPLSVQILGGLFMATLPEAILQSSSTQTDLVCGAFCLAFALFFLRLAGDATRRNAVFCGLSLGLALLSKGTAYIYVGAIILSLGCYYVACAWKRPLRVMGRDITWILLLVLAINIGHWQRSYDLYRQPLSSGVEHYENEVFSASALWVNLVRNTSLHLGIPIAAVNQSTTMRIRELLGEEADNPKTTWRGTRFGVGFSIHEDTAGNFLHGFLIVIALMCFFRVKQVERVVLWSWVGSVILGAICFCLYLKWQPWNARLHTPLFIMAIPLMSVVMAELLRLRTWPIFLLVCMVSVTALPYVLKNESRPLLPRDGFSILKSSRMQVIFHARPDLLEAYPLAVSEGLRDKPSEVGLMLGEDDWEYPLWLLSRKSAVCRLPLFRHVVIPNLTRELAPKLKLPDVIISTRPLDLAAIADRGYDIAYECGIVRVLRRKASWQ